jgi:hypothetical protein
VLDAQVVHGRRAGSSRGERRATARTPAAAQARTVFSLSPSSRAAMTGRMVPSSASALSDTARSPAQRSSSSGSVLATSCGAWRSP